MGSLKKLLVRVARQSPAMIVAMLALFVALTGTAVATTSALIGSAQIRNNSITGLDVKNRSLRPIDFRGSVRGPRGLRGLPGATGATGATGAKGDKGDTGAPGPFPDGDVPSGKTLRGSFALEGRALGAGGNILADEISYVFTLASVPTTHVVPVGGPNPPECTGSITLPQAAPGHLCVYEGQHNANAGALSVFNNRRTGSHLQVSADADGIFFITGNWAVTAP